MCGIIGVFNHQDAYDQVKAALAILKNRGKDSTNILKINSACVLGHSLHAIVNHIPQPIKDKGLLTANCEIYNWQELNEKYTLTAKNDAHLLLKLLDQFNLTKLEELDGVFAFAYLNNSYLYLARDLLGVKPLWFVHNTDSFAFASEKKALEKLRYIDIQELNPRQIIKYNLTNNKIEIQPRKFFTCLPEHKTDYSTLKTKTQKLIDKAIKKRLPDKKFGLLFSGGIDSTFLASYFKNQNCDFTCYTAVLDSETPPTDLIYAQKVAEELGLKLKIKKIKITEIPKYLKKIIPLIEDYHVVKVGVALTFYLACEMAKEDGCKVIFSGLGSEEIFAGYERHKQSANINQECISGLLKMYERDLYRDDVLTMDNNLELRLPFLDHKLISYGLKIPEKYKIKNNLTKKILRDIALDKEIPKEFALRKKVAAQYGSRFDNALGKLAKRNRFSSKSAYLRTFYPKHNLKLGILFSSGKDSTSAAYIMKKQHYRLSCLITMKSQNPDSYMFQTAGTELVELQAEAMGLPLLIQETDGKKELELKDLEKAIKKAKEKHKIDGLVSGALFSTYQRDRIEKICDKLGLKIFSPLWHKPQEKHIQEVISNDFEAIIVAIAADGLDKSWLGRKIDSDLLTHLNKLHQKTKINVAGEGGEFESLVLDCPLFKKKLQIIKSHKIMDTSCSGRLIIRNAKLIEK